MSWFSRDLMAAVLAVAIVGCSSEDGGSGSDAPAVDGGPVALRRLTTEQFARSIHDVLGKHITVPTRIDPDERRSGLLAVGSSFAGVTPSGFEKYEAAAAAVAEQALDADHRAELVSCEPASASSSDDVCAGQFIEQVGRRLFRRSLSQAEIDRRVEVARNATAVLGDFYEGLELALSSLLVSPDFLFRVERAEPDPSDPNRLRLTAASIASRLSFLLWNTSPDDALLDAAESGNLLDHDVLAAQVDRLVSSPRAEIGLRSLFSDFYDFRQFDDGLVRKDAALFPAYTQTIAENAKEQTLRTIVAHLTNGGDYRDLFTTRNTFLTRNLGLVYRVPVVEANGWEAHTFDQDSPRAGLLSHVSMMALYSHPGRSSPTLRGKFVREVLLCQNVPTPPANIDFSIVEDTMGELRTARDRLEAHVTSDSCAGCHNLMDPIGLAFENFDAVGAFREQENGVTIDASGELDGVAYDGPIGVGEALRDHPEVGPCLVRTLFRYSVGRDATLEEWPLLDFLGERFAESGFRVADLVREMVLSDGFLTTSGPREAEMVGAEP
ncbi:MAG: DUF1588 domain-containing protein [Myxococcales bacterium]|nr:DUF1588 domain-containing protein [Myxococcales bacterium]MDH3845820.1 DUF1588 domain-containing protein [Myxococcales bacterium]